MLAHQPSQLLAVDHDALVTQGGADPAIAVALELVADHLDTADERIDAEDSR